MSFMASIWSSIVKLYRTLKIYQELTEEIEDIKCRIVAQFLIWESCGLFRNHSRRLGGRVLVIWCGRRWGFGLDLALFLAISMKEPALDPN